MYILYTPRTCDHELLLPSLEGSIAALEGAPGESLFWLPALHNGSLPAGQFVSLR